MIKFDYNVKAILDGGFCYQRNQKIRQINMRVLNCSQVDYQLFADINLTIYEPEFARFELGNKFEVTIEEKK